MVEHEWVEQNVVPTENSSHCGMYGCRVCYRPRRTMTQIWQDAGDRIAVYRAGRRRAALASLELKGERHG